MNMNTFAKQALHQAESLTGIKATTKVYADREHVMNVAFKLACVAMALEGAN